jgi:hypothetical protein
MISPVAYYDSLSICERLAPITGPVAQSEVQMFAYLSCLMSVYKGQAATSWGYNFGATSEGYPFSASISEAIVLLVKQGLLAKDLDGFLQLTSRGQEELESLKSFPSNEGREAFLAGACASALSLPVGAIRVSLNQSPGLHTTFTIPSKRTRHLPAEASIETLHEQFAALSQAIGVGAQDLMVPAVIWLRFLAEVASQENTDVDVEY